MEKLEDVTKGVDGGEVKGVVEGVVNGVVGRDVGVEGFDVDVVVVVEVGGKIQFATPPDSPALVERGGSLKILEIASFPLDAVSHVTPSCCSKCAITTLKIEDKLRIIFRRLLLKQTW